MTADGLNGLGIDAGLLQHAQVGMAENVCRRAVQVEAVSDFPEDAVVDHLRQRFVPAYDETVFAVGLEQLLQLRVEGGSFGCRFYFAGDSVAVSGADI